MDMRTEFFIHTVVNMIREALEMVVFQRALLAILLTSIACGIVGSFVVVRRMTSISGGLSHAAFGGVGLGYLLGIGAMTGAMGFTVLCACVLAFVYRRQRERLDTIISMLWSLGMAIGMIALALVPGGTPDLTQYLFGSILFVPKDYLLGLLVLDVGLIAFLFVCQKDFLAIAFDEEFAEIRGIPVGAFLLVLLVVIAVSVVMLMKVAGVILTIALLTTPAVIAKQWARTLPAMMAAATAATAAFGVAGLFLTYGLSKSGGVDMPTGPVIIVLSGLGYLASSLMARWRGVRGLR